MILIALCAMLVGAVLGVRYRVLILLPAAAPALIILMAGPIVKGLPLASAAIAAMTYVVVLQVGYLCGLFTRHVLLITRVTLARSPRSYSART